MNRAAERRPAGFQRFRTKLLLAMMLIICVLTSLGIYVAQRRATAEAQARLEHDFQIEIAALDRLQNLRQAAVADRSQALAQNARIHAALEDNALDLLYPSAEDELRDVMASGTTATLHARFYRFLDHRGAVLIPPREISAGRLRPNEQRRLSQNKLSRTMQTGYLARRDAAGNSTVDEMIALPIRSTETNEVIAALVLGFKPLEAVGRGSATGMQSGILVDGKLQLSGLEPAARVEVGREVERDLTQGEGKSHSLRRQINDRPCLLFWKRLNPHSNYPPAYEVCVYPLQQLLAHERRLRWKILGAGGLFLVGGFAISEFFAGRLSRPVEKLLVVSEKNLGERRRAEAKLRTTAEELQRSARFSADASHQLKSPITVLRAGLDGLLARDDFAPEVYEEISALVHQTYWLTGVIDDLLLLSRMDAGRLQLNLGTVDLTHLIEQWSDDLRALPETEDLKIESDIPAGLQIAGETDFTALVVQNLLDNARKYNRAGGVIRIQVRQKDEQVELHIANTGRGIPVEAQPYIFERFHRAGTDDVPGHGLGLNLARELMRLHGGELRLLRSNAQWTEFVAIFRAATTPARDRG
ncbi:MAG TPA: HAMP domain-containing sensor histidine kinase [Chthoniobacterales bacterium]